MTHSRVMASMAELIDVLRLTVEWDGSDLHLKAGGPGYIRGSGQLYEVTHLRRLLPADAAAFEDPIEILHHDTWRSSTSARSVSTP